MWAAYRKLTKVIVVRCKTRLINKLLLYAVHCALCLQCTDICWRLFIQFFTAHRHHICILWTVLLNTW